MSESREGRLLEDSEQVRFTKDDMFDKVINLKLITEDGTVYVIRSDFEVVYPNLEISKLYKKSEIADSSYYVRKCEHKPSINVQYSKVGSLANSEVNIGVDIYVSNFYLLSADGNTVLSFNDINNKLVQVQVMMGYYGQFASRYKYNMNSITFNDLYDFTPGFGVDVLTVNVLYVSTEKMPPDASLHIHGEIGSSFSNEVGKIDAKTYSEIKASNLIESTAYNPSKSYLERVMYKYITTRFLKNEFEPKEGVPTIKEGNAEYMSDKNAALYGIRVFCSEGVKKISENMLKITDADGNDLDRNTYFAKGIDAVNTFNNINTAIGNDLIHSQLIDGNWLVYTVEESNSGKDINTFFDFTLDKGGQGAKYYDYTLPAIYNINLGSLASITAPFFFFVNPFDVIHFKSKYKTTSLVEYFTKRGEDGNFMILKQSVSFATVDDLNEMTLTCVPVRNKNGDLITNSEGVTIGGLTDE